MRPAPVDTIAAIATPLAESALGILRLSGPDAVAIAGRFFCPAAALSAASSHTLHHGWLVHNGRKLDEVVVGLFRAPTSYTGEDVVEISCHGSPAVLREVLRWLCDGGARLARPGEFTERAYTRGRIDLAQAEAVASLIGARSVHAAESAAQQLSGGLSDRVKTLRQGVIDLLADLEANLDFAEEAHPNVSTERLSSDLGAIHADLKSLIDTSLRGRALRDGIRVVLTGRPNVGKSSLFNAFLAQNRAIVTDVPGTTRDTIEEQLDWSGQPITLIDTAGLRKSGDAVEKIGKERAREALSRADVAVFVVDASTHLTDEDRDIAHVLGAKAVVGALNKKDRGVMVTWQHLLPLGIRSAVAVSAVNGNGLDELQRAIVSAIPASPDKSEGGLVVTNERHAERLSDAAEACAAALAALQEKRSEETVAIDLRRVAGSLAAITGEDVGEAVLDSIFRRFCIGK
jgi:tRNA modification GTPase